MHNNGHVLVIGGSGQIGQQLVRLMFQTGQEVVGTYLRNERPGLVHLEASDSKQVSKIFAQIKPAVVINASNAPGGTDACELDPSLAERFHFGIGRNLADAARQYGTKFVQISTDYVFDGEAGPYAETDVTKPLSQLGRAKLRLEEYALQNAPGTLIVRTSFVFSWTPESKTKNFVMQIFDNYRNQQLMRVPIDQISNVTYAPNFAAALVEIVQMDLAGLYHLAGTTRCSKYDWALRVVDFFGLDPSLIQGITTPELGQAGPRPLQSGFVLDKVQAVLQQTRLISLEEGLSDMKRQMDSGGVLL